MGEEDRPMYVTHLACPKCSATYESEKLIQLCKCGAPLLVEYDLSSGLKYPETVSVTPPVLLPGDKLPVSRPLSLDRRTIY